MTHSHGRHEPITTVTCNMFGFNSNEEFRHDPFTWLTLYNHMCDFNMYTFSSDEEFGHDPFTWMTFTCVKFNMCSFNSNVELGHALTDAFEALIHVHTLQHTCNALATHSLHTCNLHATLATFLQHTATHGNTRQYTATHSHPANVCRFDSNEESEEEKMHYRTPLKRSSSCTHCNTHAIHLQHTCNTLATHLQHTCNTPATHCADSTQMRN